MEKLRKFIRLIFTVGILYGVGLGIAWLIGSFTEIGGSAAVNAMLDFSLNGVIWTTAIIAVLGSLVKVTLDGLGQFIKWLGLGTLGFAIAGGVAYGILMLLGYVEVLETIFKYGLLALSTYWVFVTIAAIIKTIANAKVANLRLVVSIASSFMLLFAGVYLSTSYGNYIAAVGEDNFSLIGMSGVVDNVLMNISGESTDQIVIIDETKLSLSFGNYIWEDITGQEKTVQTDGAQALLTLDGLLAMVQTNEMNLNATRLDLNITIEDVAALEVSFADSASAISANTAAREANTIALSAAETERANLNTAILDLQAQTAANLALIESSTDADEIAALQLEQQTLETALAQAQADLLAVDASIVVINAELDAAEAAIAQAEADLLALSSELATVKASLESADAALQAQYDALNTEVQALTGGTVDLSAYSTTEEMNAAIQAAIDGAVVGDSLTDFVNKTLFPNLITAAYSSNGTISYMISSSPENYYSYAEGIGYNSAVILDLINILKDDLFPRLIALEGGA